jgi:hypothetical protein
MVRANKVINCLVLDIISDHFGPICQVFALFFLLTTPKTVAGALLTHGRLQIFNIVDRSRLNGRQVREALFVLMHHHVVKFTTQEGSARIATFYNVDLDEVFARARIPKYLWLAQTQFGLEVPAPRKTNSAREGGLWSCSLDMADCHTWIWSLV